LVEAIAYAFFDGIFLRYVVAAHWFQDEITLLFVQVFLIQKRAKFGIEVELDVPIAICFRSRAHNSSSNGKTGIDDLQSIFCAEETPVVHVRPKRYVAGWSLRALRSCCDASLNVGNGCKNAEENHEKDKYFLHVIRIHHFREFL